MKKQFLKAYNSAELDFLAAPPQHFNAIVRKSREYNIQRKVRDRGSEEDAKIEQLFKCIVYTVGRRFCVTNSKYFVLAPSHAIEGDHIGLFKGEGYSIVLRATGLAWHVVRECYVHGMIHSELFRYDDLRKPVDQSLNIDLSRNVVFHHPIPRLK